MKAKLKGANKGYSLLKKKADALKIRFHAILKKIIEVSFITNLLIYLKIDFKMYRRNYKWVT